jgi:hypothetical protein
MVAMSCPPTQVGLVLEAAEEILEDWVSTEFGRIVAFEWPRRRRVPARGAVGKPNLPRQPVEVSARERFSAATGRAGSGEAGPVYETVHVAMFDLPLVSRTALWRDRHYLATR